MRVLLVSTYDLGRQPFGLASPAAWLRRAGIDVGCIDASRDPIDDEQIRGAALVAFYLPMHTATRLAVPLIQRTRRLNPDARIAAYGLYAPLNAVWLREHGVEHVIGPEAEGELVEIATSTASGAAAARGDDGAVGRAARGRQRDEATSIPRLEFIQPDRSTLPPLARYAALQMPDGTRKVVGSTDATRGCKHLCRHCPIVPVYRGAFRVVPVERVLDDVRGQVAAGARHISFGDPDFFNGPAHARRIVERFAREVPGMTYDVTIKIEHLLRHRDLLPLLRETGCLFVTSAVESVDDDVLARLRKGHTRADFAEAVEICRAAGVQLSPTFVPFTPWTSRAGYADLLAQIAALDLIDAVAPIQLGIRLLVTAESALLELPEIARLVGPFDAASLVWPWRHEDPGVDALQADVMRVVSSSPGAPRAALFAAVSALVEGSGAGLASLRDQAAGRAAERPRVPYLTEGWYCCAEPGPEQIETL